MAKVQIVGIPSKKVGRTGLSHKILDVPAGALLVVTTGNQHSQQGCNISSFPRLIWTKRSDNSIPNAEIWTAVFTRGGSIFISTNWGSTLQTSVCYTVINYDSALNGAFNIAPSQAQPSVSLITKTTDSIIFCITTNWNSIGGARTYKGSPVETYYIDDPDSSFFHYYYLAPRIANYGCGFNAPSDSEKGSGTAVYEVKNVATITPPPDTTTPSSFTLSSPSHAITTVNLSWTAATDNIGVTSYEIYKDGSIIDTVGSGILSKTITELSASTEYSFYIKAKDAAGNSTNSNIITVLTDIQDSGNTDSGVFIFNNIVGDYSRYMAGSYRWNENSGSQIVSGVPAPKCFYRRYTWTDIEHTTQNNYQWAKFDSGIKQAIDAGQTFAFGIMTSFPGNDGIFNRAENYSGIDQKTGQTKTAQSAYPQYLHNLFQSEGTKDWVGISNDWVMNYNSIHYVDRLKALHIAITNHINTTSYIAQAGPHQGKTVQFRDVIEYIDVRGVGNYGEWHHNASIPGYPIQVSQYFPNGTWPTIQTFKNIIDAHITGFPNWQLVVIFNVLDHMLFVNTQIPDEIGVYAMSVSNNYGLLGLRDDHIGDYMSYNDLIMKDHSNSSLRTVIMERWKYAPLMGEPPGYQNTGSCGVHMCSLSEQLQNYHYSYVGNGNYGMNPVTTAVSDIMRARFKEMGNIVRLTGGSFSLFLDNLTIQLGWENIGNAPPYDRWDVTFELRTSLLGSVIWSNTSKHKLYGFLPSATPTTVQDIYPRPNIPNGTYKLCVIIKDPRDNYREPFPLGITSRQADGSYYLDDVVISNA